MDEVNAERVQVAGRSHVEFGARSGIERLLAEGLDTVTAMAAVKRERIGDSRGSDTGEDGDATLEFGEELNGAFGRVAVQAGIDGHGEDATRTKTNIDVGGGTKAAEAEPGDTKKNERHGNLGNDEEIAQSPEAAGTSEGVFAFEGGGRKAPGGGPGGEQTEEKAGGKAEKKSERENAGVDTDIEIERNRNRKTEGGEAVGGPEGDKCAECAAEKRKERGFGQDLAQKLGARGTESDADGHFMLTSGSLGEKEIGNVGAGDEKNEENDNHQGAQEKKDGVFVAWRERASLFEAEAETSVGAGMGLSETLREDLEFRGGFGVGDAGLEAGGDNDPVIVAGVEMTCIGKELIDVADRNPELRVEEKIDAPEKRRSNANDSVRMAGERE
jgi:hypothetical protein